MLPDEEYGAATASWVAVVDDTRRARTHSRTSVAVPRAADFSGWSRRQSRPGFVPGARPGDPGDVTPPEGLPDR